MFGLPRKLTTTPISLTRGVDPMVAGVHVEPMMMRRRASLSRMVAELGLEIIDERVERFTLQQAQDDLRPTTGAPAALVGAVA